MSIVETPSLPDTEQNLEEIVYLTLQRITVASWEVRQKLYAQLGIESKTNIESFQQEIIPMNRSTAITLRKNEEDLKSLLLGEMREVTGNITELYFQYVKKTPGKEMNLMMVLEEMITNAIKDGNQYHPEKNTVIQYGIQDNHLVIYIADQGSGFDPTKVEDRTIQNLLEDNHGRGLLIVDGLSLQEKYLNGSIHYLPMAEGDSCCRELVISLPLEKKIS